MQYFQIYALWTDVESYVKSPESGMIQLKDLMGFMYCLDEPIIYFASTSPTAIEKLGVAFKNSKRDRVEYAAIKLSAESLSWAFLGRADFFD